MLDASTHGTQKYSKDAFNSLSTETGTNIGSETTMDFSVLTMQAVRQNWNQAWDLFTEAALRPTFPAAEVELVRGQMVATSSTVPGHAGYAFTPPSSLDGFGGLVFGADGKGSSPPTSRTPTAHTRLRSPAFPGWNRRRR